MDWELVYHELSISLTSSLKFGSVGRTIFLTAEAITTNENFKSPVPVDKLELFLKVELGFAEYFSIQKSLDSKIRYEIPCGNQSLPTLYIDLHRFVGTNFLSGVYDKTEKSNLSAKKKFTTGENYLRQNSDTGKEGNLWPCDPNRMVLTVDNSPKL